MEVSINNQKEPTCKHVCQKLLFLLLKGGGANFNLKGVDFKNPYQSNPIIDWGRRKVKGRRGSQTDRGRVEEESLLSVNIEPSVCPWVQHGCKLLTSQTRCGCTERFSSHLQGFTVSTLMRDFSKGSCREIRSQTKSDWFSAVLFMNYVFSPFNSNLFYSLGVPVHT